MMWCPVLKVAFALNLGSVPSPAHFWGKEDFGSNPAPRIALIAAELFNCARRLLRELGGFYHTHVVPVAGDMAYRNRATDVARLGQRLASDVYWNLPWGIRLLPKPEWVREHHQVCARLSTTGVAITVTAFTCLDARQQPLLVAARACAAEEVLAVVQDTDKEIPLLYHGGAGGSRRSQLHVLPNTGCNYFLCDCGRRHAKLFALRPLERGDILAAGLPVPLSHDTSLIVHFDGSCKSTADGEPVGGAGVVGWSARAGDITLDFARAMPLPRATDSLIAEAEASLLALRLAIDAALRLHRDGQDKVSVLIQGDSLAVLRHWQGLARLRRPDLVALFTKGKTLLATCPFDVAFNYVPREGNAYADYCADIAARSAVDGLTYPADALPVHVTLPLRPNNKAFWTQASAALLQGDPAIALWEQLHCGDAWGLAIA